MVPELARKAARVDIWQRTPNHIVPRGNYAYSDRQKALFSRFPLLHRLYRWKIRARMDWLLFPIIRCEYWRARLARQFEPASEDVHVAGWASSRPGLPLITSLATGDEELERMRRAVMAAMQAVVLDRPFLPTRLPDRRP